MSQTLQFDAAGKRWKCDLATYTCTEIGPARKKSPDRPPVPNEADDTPDAESPWVDDSREQPIAVQFQPKKDTDRARSPDGKWTAQIKEHNIVLRDADGNETPLTKDGKDGFAYCAAQLVARLEIAHRVPRRAGRTQGSPHPRLVAARRRPRCAVSSRPYDLPGDKFAQLRTASSSTSRTRRTSPVEDREIRFATGYETPRLRWTKDGSTVTYPRTERGHQRFRLVEVDARTGKSRNLIDEKTRDVHLDRPHREHRSAARHVAGEVRRDHLRLREERLAAPLSDRREDRQGEERHHDRRVRRSRSRADRRGEAAGLVPRQREESRIRIRTSSTTTASTSTARDSSR